MREYNTKINVFDLNMTNIIIFETKFTLLRHRIIFCWILVHHLLLIGRLVSN